MASTSKTQLLNQVFDLLRKRYKIEPASSERMTVLEAVVYGITLEGSTREQANQVLSRFKDDFFDWNEVRVSSLGEVEGIMAGLPSPDERGRRVRLFLRQLFAKSYSFTLDALLKKPQKELVKALQPYEAGRDDFIVATVIQQAMQGHAIPIDPPVRRALERLGVTDEKTETEALRASLERAIPKNRGREFRNLLEDLAHDTCVIPQPDCPRCVLQKICPTAAELAKAEKLAARAPKPDKQAPTSPPLPEPTVEPKPASRSIARTDKPEKPTPKAAAKPPKPEPKSDTKSEAKPAPKRSEKPEKAAPATKPAKPAPKATAKPEKPALKAATKPADAKAPPKKGAAPTHSKAKPKSPPGSEPKGGRSGKPRRPR